MLEPMTRGVFGRVFKLASLSRNSEKKITMEIGKHKMAVMSDRWVERGILVAATIGCLGTYVIALATGMHSEFSYLVSLLIAITVIVGIDLFFIVLRYRLRMVIASRANVVEMKSFVVEDKGVERWSA
jgi:hypothetical protein